MNRYYFVLVLIFLTFFCFSQNADALVQKGKLLYEKGDYQNAIVQFEKSVVKAKSSKNYNALIVGYNNLGNSYSQIGKSEVALKNYLLSIAIAKLNNDKLNIAKTSKNIGALYEEQKDFVLAMQYYDSAFRYAQQVNNYALIADCLNNMGIVYEQENKYNKALEAYSKALVIYKSEKDEQRIAMTLNNLAIVYKYLKNYQESIKNYKASLVLSQKLGDQFMIAANQNNLGNVYALEGDYSKSLELCLLSNANAKAIKAQEVIIESLDGIAIAFEKLNQYPKAIQYRKNYELEKENFFNKERSGLLADMQVKYETQKKEDEIKLLKKETKINTLEIQKQKAIIEKRNYFILGFLLLLLLLTHSLSQHCAEPQSVC